MFYRAGSKRNWIVFSLSILLAATASPPLFAWHHKDKKSKEEKRREKAIRKEMESPYKHWLEDEVPYIITPQERTAFLKLTTDAEREQFIEAFWERRNPNPGSPENAFKEEYYRRIAYANEHYSSGIPGWKTDRGRIYIMYGPPDDIDSHPSGGEYTPPPGTMPMVGNGTAGGEMTTYPFEDWTYHYIPGIGENVELEFVDPSGSGEYHLTMNPCEKDAMAMVPGDTTGCQGGVAIGSMWNPNLIYSPSQSSGPNQYSANSSYSDVTSAIMDSNSSMDEFNRLDLYSKIFQPPQVKFNDLKAVVTSTLSAQLLPFRVRTDFIRVTEGAVLVPITIEVANKDLEFQNKDGVMHATMDVYGQLTTLSGRMASTFEQGVVLDVPQHDFQQYVTHKSVYQRVVPLSPGLYKLSVVLKDDANGHMGSDEIGIRVPRFPDGQLCNSSLILADLIQPLPTSQVGSGPFVIGGDKVRPSVDQVFTQSQRLGVYMQVYNLGVDPKTHRPSADIQYQLLQGGKALFSQTENAAKLPDASEQITIAKTMPVAKLAPGKYTFEIKVTDNIKKQTDTQSASFQVK